LVNKHGSIRGPNMCDNIIILAFMKNHLSSYGKRGEAMSAIKSKIKAFLSAHYKYFTSTSLRDQEVARYRYLFDAIKHAKCRRIMEIGTWNGDHAKQMIEVSKKYYGDKVEYYGFDLFELLKNEMYDVEYVKIPPSEEKVKNKLMQTGVKIRLFKGNTRETLPRVINILPKMDLIFIDGGHSIDTIKNDWKYARQLMHEKTVVLFDDYWNRDDAGCKQIIENINRKKYAVKILRIEDKFQKEWGMLKIKMVKVVKK
jgi:hypothetical protein